MPAGQGIMVSPGEVPPNESMQLTGGLQVGSEVLRPAQPPATDLERYALSVSLR
jgi:hypothetical protein